MRILIIVPKFYGAPWHEGVKNIVRRLVKYLRDKDHEVLIVSFGQKEVSSHIGEFGEEIFYIGRGHENQVTRFSLITRVFVWLSLINCVRDLVEKKEPDVALLFASGSLFLGIRAFIFRLFMLGKQSAL